MEILGRGEILVGPNILRTKPLLSEQDYGLVRELVPKVLSRQFSRVALRRTFEEEMYHVGRTMIFDIERLIDGVWISVGPRPEAETEEAEWGTAALAILDMIAMNLEGYEHLTQEQMSHKLGIIKELVNFGPKAKHD